MALPEVFDGHLRLLRRGADDPAPDDADQDPAAVVFGLGYGLVHESLPFAASVLEALKAAEPATADCPGGPGRRSPAPALTTEPPGQARPDPADVADRIRHLGALHDAGLLTDDEFSSKKAELLAEL